MGKIQKQVSGSILMGYFGVVLGYINSVLLFPFFFSPDQYGLVLVLVSIGVVFQQFSLIGSNRAIIKFAPLYKKIFNNQIGILFVGICISLVGFAVLLLLYVIFKNEILAAHQSQSALFINHYYYALPIAFFLMIDNLLDAYLQTYLKTLFSTFVKQVVVRLVAMALLGMYYLRWLEFEGFITAYSFIYAGNVLLILGYLFYTGRFKGVVFEKTFFRWRQLRLILNYCVYSIMSGFALLIITRVDVLMIGMMLTLDKVATYGIGVFIAAVIYIPSQQIARMALPMLSGYFKDKLIVKVQELYKKTALIQTILASCLFCGIWVNIERILEVLPPEYYGCKYVIFYLGIGRVIETAFGVTDQVLITSSYFRFDLVANSILIVVGIVANMIFIPWLDIEGAAIATAIAILTNRLVRWLYIHHKMKMHPFSKQIFLIWGIALLGIGIGYILPRPSNWFADVSVTSVTVGVWLVGSLYLLKVSPTLNASALGVLRRAKLIK